MIAVKTALHSASSARSSIAVAVGAVIGALQGYVIGRLGINSLVFTIGTLILLRGLTYLLAATRRSRAQRPSPSPIR